MENIATIHYMDFFVSVRNFTVYKSKCEAETDCVFGCRGKSLRVARV